MTGVWGLGKAFAPEGEKSIDEHRKDFEPTIWKHADNMDLKQVWFAGAHADIGGSYKPDADGFVVSDNSLGWMIKEAEDAGLTI